MSGCEHDNFNRYEDEFCDECGMPWEEIEKPLPSDPQSRVVFVLKTALLDAIEVLEDEGRYWAAMECREALRRTLGA